MILAYLFLALLTGQQVFGCDNEGHFCLLSSTCCSGMCSWFTCLAPIPRRETTTWVSKTTISYSPMDPNQSENCVNNYDECSHDRKCCSGFCKRFDLEKDFVISLCQPMVNEQTKSALIKSNKRKEGHFWNHQPKQDTETGTTTEHQDENKHNTNNRLFESSSTEGRQLSREQPKSNLQDLSEELPQDSKLVKRHVPFEDSLQNSRADGETIQETEQIMETQSQEDLQNSMADGETMQEKQLMREKPTKADLPTLYTVIPLPLNANPNYDDKYDYLEFMDDLNKLDTGRINYEEELTE